MKPVDEQSYNTAILHPRLLRFLCRLVDRQGGDPARLCAGLGFVLEDLNRPELRLSHEQTARFIQRMFTAMPDKERIIRACARAPITSYGLVGMAQMSSATLGDAIGVGIEYQEYAGIPARLSLETGEKEFYFILDEAFHDPEVGAFIVEVTAAYLINSFTLFQGHRFTPLRVELAYPSPDVGRGYQAAVFDCPVSFNAPRNQVVGLLGWLDMPLPGHERLTHTDLLAQVRREASAFADHGLDLVEAVGRILYRNLRHPPSVQAVARDMNMSERTLRRRLDNAGVTFRDIFRRVRIAMAIELVRSKQLSLQEVAERVGFSGVEQFRRAFKTWTGKPPSQFLADPDTTASRDTGK